ncbi:uncharacterized protein [Anabrus simplex]|uniref:uncharacterized protein isoform X3 n=1 Tax=Anabrus simplex TaxID=316456 RepID=UPI0035A3B45F
MEEPVFVKCEPVWPEDTEETSNFEENAVHSFDNGVKIKDDPHAAITDLSLEESSVNVKDEEQTVVEQVLCFKEENKYGLYSRTEFLIPSNVWKVIQAEEISTSSAHDLPQNSMVFSAGIVEMFSTSCLVKASCIMYTSNVVNITLILVGT